MASSWKYCRRISLKVNFLSCDITRLNNFFVCIALQGKKMNFKEVFEISCIGPSSKSNIFLHVEELYLASYSQVTTFVMFLLPIGRSNLIDSLSRDEYTYT